MSLDTASQTMPNDLTSQEKEDPIGSLLKKLGDLKAQYLTKENISLFINTMPGRVLLVTLGVTFIVCLFALFHHPQSDSSNSNHLLSSHKPTDIEIMASVVNQGVSSSNKQTQAEVAQLTEQLQVVQQALKKLSEQNETKQLTDLVIQSNSQMTQKINDLASNFDQVKQSLQPHHYLDPKSLPFKVTAVDIWGGRPYATVDMDNKEELIGVNESRAGWTVNTIDFSSRTIEFKNEKDQYIKIQLES